jgi:putative MATE family efflux protein
MESNKSILQKTISVAWPAALEGLAVNIVDLVDMAMVSKLGLTAVAAVGVTVQPKRILLMPILSLSIGATALVSRQIGAKQEEKAIHSMQQFLLLALAAGAVLYGFGFLFAEPFMRFSGANEETLPGAAIYFKILVVGQYLQAMSLMINACLRAAGKTRISMTTNLTANIVNVIFNYLLIFGNFGFPKWGVAGAAAAASLGSLSAFLISVWSVRKKAGNPLYLRYDPASWKPDFRSVSSVRSVTFSAFQEQFFQRMGLFLFTRLAASLGTVEFALYQMIMNTGNLQGYTIDGVATAATALTGQSLGAGKPDLAERYGRASLKIGYGLQLIMMAFFLVFCRQVLGFFTDEPSVIAAGIPLMFIMEAGSYPGSGATVYFGALRGAGDTKAPARVTLIIVAVVRPILSWLFCYPLGWKLTGIWVGYTIAHILRWYLIRQHYWKGAWKSIVL